MQKLNTKLLIAIKKRGLPQFKLAQMISGLSESRLSKIINGHAQPTPDEIQSIASILGAPPSQLGFAKKGV